MLLRLSYLVQILSRLVYYTLISSHSRMSDFPCCWQSSSLDMTILLHLHQMLFIVSCRSNQVACSWFCAYFCALLIKAVESDSRFAFEVRTRTKSWFAFNGDFVADWGIIWIYEVCLAVLRFCWLSLNNVFHHHLLLLFIHQHVCFYHFRFYCRHYRILLVFCRVQQLRLALIILCHTYKVVVHKCLRLHVVRSLFLNFRLRILKWMHSVYILSLHILIMVPVVLVYQQLHHHLLVH